MNRTRLILILTTVCLLLSSIGCGSGGSTIETPAGEMNFSAADLGSDWSLQLDQSLDEIPGLSEEKAARDASLRTFATQDGRTIASQVLTVKTVAGAENSMAEGFAEPTIAELKAQLPGITFEQLASPTVGDETVLVGGNISELGLNVYVLTFRKSNVIAMIFLLGPETFASEASTADYGRKLEAKIQ
jgi:hypothetical protein